MTDELEEMILGMLGTFLENDNSIRESSERLYDKLQQQNPNLMVQMLSKVVKSHTNTFECLSALCKLGDAILASSIRDESPLSSECLKDTRTLFLNVLSCDYPDQMKDYVMSVIEDFLYITDGDQSDWPELVPFFLRLLESDTYYGLLFFNTLIQVAPGNDLHILLSPKLQLDSPDPRIVYASIKYLMTSLYINFGHDPRIVQLPEALASLPDCLFAPAFQCVWKLMVKDPSLFVNIHVDIIGMLLTMTGDPTRPELQRRAALFFFTKVIKRLPPLRKIAIGAADKVVQVIVNCLTRPKQHPDLYSEGKLALEVLSCIPEMREHMGLYCTHENLYIASVLVQYSASEHRSSIFEYIQSNDELIAENGLTAVDSIIDGSMELGRVLLDGMKRSTMWEQFIQRLTKWCHVADTDVISSIVHEIFAVLDRHENNSESMLCETILYSKKFGLERMDHLVMRLRRVMISGDADARHVEVMSLLVRVMHVDSAKIFLCAVMPHVIANPSCVNSVDFCLFVTGNPSLMSHFLDATVDSLIRFVNKAVQVVESTEMISTLVDLTPEKLSHRVNDLSLLAKRFTKGHVDGKIRLAMYRMIANLANHYDRLDGITEWIPTQLEEETENECYEVLLTTARKVVEKADDEVVLEILNRITLVISRAVEEDSEELFANAASLFLAILRRVPDAATKVFFQIQRVFPRYDRTDVAGSLRCFSLLLWTDFVIYGPEGHVEQYRYDLADDLRRMMKTERDENVRIDAIISASTYYSTMKVSELELQDTLDIMYAAASDKDGNSDEIRDIMTSAFAQVFERTWNEKLFPKRCQQLLSLLPLSERSTEIETVYECITNLTLVCVNNPELVGFTNALTACLAQAVSSEMISAPTIRDIRNRITNNRKSTPEELQGLVALCTKMLQL